MTNAHPPRSRDELLHLLATYFQRGQERVTEIRSELPLAPRGGFRTPGKILILLFASRAGSNFFGQLLSSTGWFNEIGESFNPGQLTKIRDRHNLANIHEAAQWMIDNRGTPQAFGIKAGFYVLTAAAELGFLPEVMSRAQFVLLRRHDRVAQAVSLVKGKLSGQMHSGQVPRRELTDSDYDSEALAVQLEQIRKRELQYSDLVARLGKTAPVVCYEDICADPARHVAAICDLMSLEMPTHFEPRKVRLNVLRDELSHRWSERFRAENPGIS